MAFPATNLIDCLQIAKKFERGAIYATNEASVFAMLGPVLDTTRIQTTSFVEQLDAEDAISVPQGAQERLSSAQSPLGATANILGDESTASVARNIDKADDKDEAFLQTLAGNFGLTDDAGNFNVNGVFDSECIPCGFRFDNLDALGAEIGAGVGGGLSAYLQFWQQLLRNQWEQLQAMLQMFTNTDPFIDLCALIKFLTEFMCVPDIARMLSALMALMSKVSFEFGGVFDLILQLIGPLMSSFLSNIVSTIERYVMMVIRPLECIIDSIQALLAKLDYNILFTNIDSLDKQIDMGGPRRGAKLPGNAENERRLRKEDPRGDFTFRLDKPRLDSSEPKVPWIDGQIPRRDIAGGDRFLEADFNLAGPLSTAIDGENARNQEAVEVATEELRAIRRAARNVDGSDPEAIRKQRDRERAGQEKLDAAVEKRDLTYIGRTNAAIDRGVAGLKSSLIMIIGYMREAVASVEAFFDFLFDEFKKLMGEYVGGSGGLVGDLIGKLALSQLIGIVTQIYKAILSGSVCPEDANDIKVENWVPEQSGMTLWTEDDGTIHIEGDDQEIRDAMENLVQAIGATPPETPTAAEKDKGGTPVDPGQQLKGLVEFTGDPVLDSEIARMTEQLVTPVNVTFKCPLQTSVAQSEQVNQWIREVNTF